MLNINIYSIFKNDLILNKYIKVNEFFLINISSSTLIISLKFIDESNQYILWTLNNKNWLWFNTFHLQNIFKRCEIKNV